MWRNQIACGKYAACGLSKVFELWSIHWNFNKLECSSVLSQANVESDATVRYFKIQNTTIIPSGNNFSVNNLDSGHKVPVIKSQAVHQYESQTKCIHNSESSSTALSLFDMNHEQSNGIVGYGNLWIKRSSSKLTHGWRNKGRGVIFGCWVKHGSWPQMLQETSFPALDVELTLLEVNRKENNNRTAVAARFRQGDTHKLSVNSKKLHMIWSCLLNLLAFAEKQWS